MKEHRGVNGFHTFSPRNRTILTFQVCRSCSPNAGNGLDVILPLRTIPMDLRTFRRFLDGDFETARPLIGNYYNCYNAVRLKCSQWHHTYNNPRFMMAKSGSLDVPPDK